ncbi:MAG: hypothetical protein ACR2I8_05175, partial [Steroidobacteraceae bacterium]
MQKNTTAMANPRMFLWIGVALLVWMNVIQWERYRSETAARTAAANAAARPAQDGVQATTTPGAATLPA